MQDIEGHILPIYFVADESYSMEPFIDVLNEGLTSLLEAMETNPHPASKIRFSVIGFSDTAEQYLPPTELTYLGQMPEFNARTSTSYKSAFDLLAQLIPEDVSALKAQNYAVYRPSVFFLSDGAPNSGDDWEASHAVLTSDSFVPARPNILAFGVNQADENVIQKVACPARFAFKADGQIGIGDALKEFMLSLVNSVVMSGSSMGQEGGGLQMEEPEGWLRIEADQI